MAKIEGPARIPFNYLYNNERMTIPRSLLSDLKRVPDDRPAVVLLRHAARFPITDPYEHSMVGLTEEGERDAEVLGVLLKARFKQGRLLSSPVERCINTAAAIARGAAWPVSVQVDDRLSHPFIAPGWLLVERGKLVNSIPFQVQVVLSLMLQAGENLPRLDVFVTHDTVVGAVAGGILRAPVFGQNWPGFLEGVCAWREADRVILCWRGIEAAFNESLEKIE